MLIDRFALLCFRALARNLILGYFHTPSNKKQEVINVISRALDFEGDELMQLQGEASGGWLRGLFKKVVATQTPSTPKHDTSANKSFFGEAVSLPQLKPACVILQLVLNYFFFSVVFGGTRQVHGEGVNARADAATSCRGDGAADQPITTALLGARVQPLHHSTHALRHQHCRLHTGSPAAGVHRDAELAPAHGAHLAQHADVLVIARHRAQLARHQNCSDVSDTSAKLEYHSEECSAEQLIVFNLEKLYQSVGTAKYMCTLYHSGFFWQVALKFRLFFVNTT